MKTISNLRHVRRRQASAAFRRRAVGSATSCRSRSKDPIRLKGGMNLYAFCGCDPMNYTDPTGECPLIFEIGEIHFRQAPSGKLYGHDTFGHSVHNGVPIDPHKYAGYAFDCYSNSPRFSTACHIGW